MNTTMMPYHEVANLFPLLDGPDFDALKADIAANGQREPIWTYQGEIIDGRNRHRCCVDLGITPNFREWDGKGSLLAFVLSLNLHRRHLDSSQRAALAVNILPLLEAEAKERQKVAASEGGKQSGKSRRGNKKSGQAGSVVAGGPQPISEAGTARDKVGEAKVPQKVAGGSSGEAREQAAKLAGTNKTYVSKAKMLKEEAPDLFGEVQAGTKNVNVAVNEAKRRSKRAEWEQKAIDFDKYTIEVEIPQSYAAKHLQRLEAEAKLLPHCQEQIREHERLQAEHDAMNQEMDRLIMRIEESSKQLYRQRIVTETTVREAVENTHGRVVLGRRAHFCLSPERWAKAMQDIEAEEDSGPGFVEWERRRCCGLCMKCGSSLREEDKHACCNWCREHRGKTHCDCCGVPLATVAKGWEHCPDCKTCDECGAKLTEAEAKDWTGDGNDCCEVCTNRLNLAREELGKFLDALQVANSGQPN